MGFSGVSSFTNSGIEKVTENRRNRQSILVLFRIGSEQKRARFRFRHVNQTSVLRPSATSVPDVKSAGLGPHYVTVYMGDWLPHTKGPNAPSTRTVNSSWVTHCGASYKMQHAKTPSQGSVYIRLHFISHWFTLVCRIVRWYFDISMYQHISATEYAYACCALKFHFVWRNYSDWSLQQNECIFTTSSNVCR